MELDIEMEYCYKCGRKQDDAVAPEIPEDQNQE
jgi:hypothetical protein